MPPIWASKQDYVTLLWQIVSRGWALPCIPGLAAAALPRNIYVMLASAVNRISYYCNQEKIYIILPKLLMLFLCTYILHFNSIMNVKFTLEFIYLMLHLSTVVKWRTYLERKGYSTFSTVWKLSKSDLRSHSKYFHKIVSLCCCVKKNSRPSIFSPFLIYLLQTWQNKRVYTFIKTILISSFLVWQV